MKQVFHRFHQTPLSRFIYDCEVAGNRFDTQHDMEIAEEIQSDQKELGLLRSKTEWERFRRNADDLIYAAGRLTGTYRDNPEPYTQTDLKNFFILSQDAEVVDMLSTEGYQAALREAVQRDNMQALSDAEIVELEIPATLGRNYLTILQKFESSANIIGEASFGNLIEQFPLFSDRLTPEQLELVYLLAIDGAEEHPLIVASNEGTFRDIFTKAGETDRADKWFKIANDQAEIIKQKTKVAEQQEIEAEARELATVELQKITKRLNSGEYTLTEDVFPFFQLIKEHPSLEQHLYDRDYAYAKQIAEGNIQYLSKEEKEALGLA